MANGGWTLIAVVRLRAGEGYKRYISVSSTNTNAIDALADGGNWRISRWSGSIFRHGRRARELAAREVRG